MRIDVPKILYRGESLSHIAKKSILAFNNPSQPQKSLPNLIGGNNGKIESITGEEISIDNTDYTMDMTYDEVGVVKNHQCPLVDEHLELTLSFTSSFDVAKWFATDEGQERGVVYEVDTQFNSEILNEMKFRTPHNPEHPKEHEWTLTRTNTSFKFPFKYILDISMIDPDKDEIVDPFIT